ncbi:MAG: methyltransferase [Acidiferrobacterales bacterium]
MRPRGHKKKATENSGQARKLKRAYQDFLVKHYSPQALLCGGLRIYAPSKIYHPHPHSSSHFMLTNFPKIHNARILDMGTGTGVLGLHLADRGLGNNVTLSDVNPTACATAEINAMINERWVKVVHADVWEGIPKRRYDVVIWNLPLLDHPINEDIDIIACDPDNRLVRRFLAGLPRYLARDGRAYLVTNSVVDSPHWKRWSKGFVTRVLAVDERDSDMNIHFMELRR